jgi:pimeloyl-ACP methyl ester carboxylesterase
MGGYFALVGAAPARAQAVVAICPAPAELLTLGLASGRFRLRADRPALEALFAEHDEQQAAAALDAPLLLLHAAGDEQVPVERSRELARVAPRCRYVELPGGHHSSVQHDAELQGESVRFLSRALRR